MSSDTELFGHRPDSCPDSCRKANAVNLPYQFQALDIIFPQPDVDPLA
jgi:hypothetical protein